MSITTCDKYIYGRQVEDRIRELEDELKHFEQTALDQGWTFRKGFNPGGRSTWVATGPDNDGAPGNVYIDESREVVVAAAADEAGSPEATYFDFDELDELRQLREEAQHYGDWPNCTLINEDHWVEYAQQVSDDLGGVTNGWPHRHIDWEAAADELKLDFTEVRFGGTSFFVRT